jgi:predicted ATPase
VIIGGNATGKTTLLKVMYSALEEYDLYHQHYLKYKDNINDSFLSMGLIKFSTAGKTSDSHILSFSALDDMKHGNFMINGHLNNTNEAYYQTFCYGTKGEIIVNYAEKSQNTKYIPEKDMLEHAKGLLTFIEQKQTGFSQIYKDVLINAQDIPTQVQSETQQKVGKMIVDTIGGDVRWDKGEGSFYTLRTDGTRIPFANEASGYKKLGYLGLLITSGQLEKESVLLWDEPENSLNPELMPVLVDILLELQRGGVQIFIATHSEILASYFDVLRNNDDNVMFYSLYKDGGQIKADKSERFDLLTPNNLKTEPVKLYEKEIARWLGDE